MTQDEITQDGRFWWTPRVAQWMGVSGLLIAIFFGSIGGDLTGLGLFLCVLATLLAGREFWSRIRAEHVTWAIVVLVLYIVVRARLAHYEFPSENLSLGAKDLLLSSGLLGTLVAWWLGGNTRRVGWVLGAAFLGVLVRVVLFMIRHGELNPQDRMYAGTSPNAMGLYLATGLLGLIVFAPAYWRMVQRRALLLRAGVILLWVALVIFCFQALLLTQSRAAWLSLILVVAVVLIWYVSRRMTTFSVSRRRALFGLALIVTGLCSAIVYLNRNIVGERVALAVAGTPASSHVGPLDTSTRVRLELWHVGLQKFTERPLFGWGPDSSQMLIRQSTKPPTDTFRDFHNLYIHLLATIGLVGALLGLVVGLLVLRGLWQSLRAGWMPRNVAVFASGAIALYLIGCFFQLRHDGATGRVYVSLLFGVAYTYWLHRPRAPTANAGLSPSVARP